MEVDITNIRSGKDKVIVRLNKPNDKVKIGNEYMYLETMYEPADHVQVIGTVIAPVNDLKPGDKVYMEYLTVLLALADKFDKAASYPDPKWFENNGDLYVIIPCTDIYLYIRGGKITMLNNNVMLSPILVEQKFSDPKESEKWGIAEYGYEKCLIFFKASKLRVEHPMHKTLFGNKFIVNQKFFLGKLPLSKKYYIEKGLIK